MVNTMARPDDYELLPRDEIRRLREQIDDLRGQKHPVHEDINDNVKKLSDRMQDLLMILERASDDLREEDKESEIIAKKINPLFDKLSEIEEQNGKIARAMVGFNSLIESKVKELGERAESLEAAAEVFTGHLSEIREKLDEIQSQQSRMKSRLMDAPTPIKENMMIPPPPVPEGQVRRDAGYSMFKH